MNLPRDGFRMAPLHNGPLDGAVILVHADLPPAVEVVAITETLDAKNSALVPYSTTPRALRRLPQDAQVFVYRRDGESGRYVYAMRRSDP